MNGNSIFDNLDSQVVARLSEQPAMLADDKALAESGAAFAYSPTSLAQEPQPTPDACARTPTGEALPLPIVEALNLALLGEYLETEFYSRGLNTPGLIPSELRQTFIRILLNEIAHREILIGVLGTNAIPKPAFDYTAVGTLPDVFSNFNTFVGLGQTFEDNGVRAIKGQAPVVQASDFVLTTALRFHSVEGRHAAELRRIRGEKAWITLNSRGTLPPLSQPVYNGEENVTQGGINLVTLTGYPATTVSEAFDEPLTRKEVLSNIRPFISRDSSQVKSRTMRRSSPR
jgi:hypothetical protein